MTLSPRFAASGRGSGCDPWPPPPAGRRPTVNTRARATAITAPIIHGVGDDGRRRTGDLALVAMGDSRRRRLQRAKLGEDFRSVEQSDVLRLHRCKLADRPAQMHEMRLERMP